MHVLHLAARSIHRQLPKPHSASTPPGSPTPPDSTTTHPIPPGRRVRTNAPDAQACLEKLAAARSRLLGYYAALTLRTPSVLGEILIGSVEPEASPQAGALLEAPLPHWVYAMKQLELSPEQVCMWGRKKPLAHLPYRGVCARGLSW